MLTSLVIAHYIECMKVQQKTTELLVRSHNRLQEFKQAEDGKVSAVGWVVLSAVVLGGGVVGSVFGVMPDVVTDFFEGAREGRDTGRIVSPQEIDPYGLIDASVDSVGRIATEVGIQPIPTTEPIPAPLPTPIDIPGGS